MPRRAHLQVDDSVCAVALHGVELQIPLEVLGVETGDGQTVAEASLCTATDRGDEGFKKDLFCVTLQAAALPMEQTGLLSSLLCALQIIQFFFFLRKRKMPGF